MSRKVEILRRISIFFLFQLDSTSAREVMSSVANLARAEGIIIIATIHQPSIATLSQFSQLVLMAEGKTCFKGHVDNLERFFERWGWPVPRFVSLPVFRFFKSSLTFSQGNPRGARHEHAQQ